MQRIDGHLEHFEERNQPSDPINAADKDERSSRVSKKEVIQIEILFIGKAAHKCTFRIETKGKLTFSRVMHSTILSRKVATRRPSGEMSMTSGLGSLKSSFVIRSSRVLLELPAFLLFRQLPLFRLPCKSLDKVAENTKVLMSARTAVVSALVLVRAKVGSSADAFIVCLSPEAY
jgi:hypothetical protein